MSKTRKGSPAAGAAPGAGEATTELRFEAAFEELQELVRQLETGQLTLDESLSLFERGVLLARVCAMRLEEAEKRIEMLQAGQREPFPAKGERA